MSGYQHELIPSAKLRLADLPLPGARWHDHDGFAFQGFAQTFDGYQHVGWFGQHEFSHRARDDYLRPAALWGKVCATGSRGSRKGEGHAGA